MAFLALVLSAATPLYDPLSTGRDDTWLYFVLFGGAAVGLGAGTRHAAALLVVLPLGFVGFVQFDATAGFFFLMFILPLMLAGTAAGFLLGHLARDRAWLVAVGSFGAACVPVAYAVAEGLERGERLPAAIERTLPLEGSLRAACPGDGYDREAGRLAERQGRALIAVLRDRPNDLARYLYRFADSPDESKLITVREVAEEQLQRLESAHDPPCAIPLRTRLRRALDG